MAASRFVGLSLLAVLTTGPAAASEGVAVLELFTSEGCSSCPPAEALLNEIDEEAQRTGRPVYVLAFHVDYWNDLGWIDRFSTEAFSERQRRYAPRVSGGRVYTPQLVVNGVTSFVGSDRTRALRARDAALEEGAPVSVRLAASRTPRGVKATATLEGAPRGARVSFALVADGHVSDVKSGENRGRRLVHRGVVHRFESHVVGAAPVEVELEAPRVRGEDKLGWSVVAFVQDKDTGRVLGASRVPLDR